MNAKFQGCLSHGDRRRLTTLLQTLETEADHFLGYPCNRAFDYSELFPFLAYTINNVGDPNVKSLYRLNTHEFEREVVDFFAGQLHAPQEIWGYVTNGGTEGNLYGLYLGREILPQGIVYYSEDTHYSVAKILRILHARSIMIKSRPDGEIDYEDLAETLKIHRDVPPILLVNIGTTMKGAIDNLDKIHAILKNLAIHDFYIHADAALSGMILPFVDNPQPFDFRHGIDSIAISGHKMIGSPLPCGVVLAKKSHVRQIARSVEYVGTLDTTISGSRNGITPLFLWYAICSRGVEGFREAVESSLQMARYAVDKFRQAGVDAWRHRNSLTVVFPRQAEETLKRWQIAVHDDIAHIITMPHVEKWQIDALLQEMLDETNHHRRPQPGRPAG